MQACGATSTPAPNTKRNASGGNYTPPFEPDAPQGAGPLPLGRRRLARGNRLQENEGEVSPCPSLLRARIQAAASPQHTQSATPTLIPNPNRIPRKCQTHGHASVPALPSPLRGFAEFSSTSTPPAQRFPPVLHQSTRGLVEPHPPSRKGNSVPSSHKWNPSPMPQAGEFCLNSIASWHASMRSQIETA